MRRIFLLIFILLFPGTVSGQVIINEVAWMGTPVEGLEEKDWWRYEWIELYNTTDASISVDGWLIELYREKLDWAIPLHGTIEPNGYFLVTSSEKVPNFDVQYANLAGKMVNSGQRVVLREAKDAIIEEIDARDGWFGGDNDGKYTMERWKTDKKSTSPTNWGTSEVFGGTPKSENSIAQRETLKVENAGAVLSEIQPKRDLSRSSLLGLVSNTVFLRAFLLAVAGAVVILLLKRYLLVPRA